MRMCSRQWFTVRRFSTEPRGSAEQAVADLTHGEVDEKVKIVAVTSCAGGIAHTYMAAEALQKAAKTAGDEIKVEIQGSMGVEHELTQEEIESADLVIWVADIAIMKAERFQNVRVIEAIPHDAIADANKVLHKAKREAGLI
jgi:fructose-specific phosphotransferase system IIB component